MESENRTRILQLEQQVARLQWQVEFLFKRLNLPYEEIDETGDPGLAAVEDLLRKGRKLEAIKVMRETRGLGLKEAKDLVEEMERRL
jgi:ribosomal protein L7/L12